MYVCMYVCMYVHACMHAYKMYAVCDTQYVQYVCTYVCVYMYICMYVCLLPVHTHKCKCVVLQGLEIILYFKNIIY